MAVEQNTQQAEEAEGPSGRDSIWSLPYVILMAVNFFQSMAAFMTNTTLPVYADRLGATTSVVGVVVGSFAVTALLVRPFAGPAFDSFSRKKLLICAQAIICTSLVLYGVVDTLPALVAVRLFHGIGIGCGGPLAMSLVSEFLPESRFASGISIYTLAQSFAQVIGPATGIYLMEAFGFSPAYFLAASFLLVAMCGIFSLREPERELPPYELKLNRMFAREALDKGFVLMLFAISFSCMTAYLVLYAYEMGVEGVGLYFTVYALCLLGTRPLFGKLADRYGSERMLLVGSVCFAASYVSLSVAGNMAGLLVAAVLGSAGFGSCAPLIQTLALGSVPASRRGAASNTSFMGLDLGMLIGPGVGGAVVELLIPATGSLEGAYSLMWIVMLVPLALAFVVIVRWNIKRR